MFIKTLADGWINSDHVYNLRLRYSKDGDAVIASCVGGCSEYENYLLTTNLEEGKAERVLEEIVARLRGRAAGGYYFNPSAWIEENFPPCNHEEKEN